MAKFCERCGEMVFGASKWRPPIICQQCRIAANAGRKFHRIPARSQGSYQMWGKKLTQVGVEARWAGRLAGVPDRKTRRRKSK